MNDLEKFEQLFKDVGQKYHKEEQQFDNDDVAEALYVYPEGNKPPMIFGFNKGKYIGFFKHHL